MGDKVDLVYVADGLAVATYDALLITLVRTNITLPFLDAAQEAGRALSDRYPDGIGSLTLVPTLGGFPEGDLRERAKQNLREANRWVRAGSTVVGGTGFFASATRSVLLAITFVTSGPPRNVHSSPDEAIDWLLERLDRRAVDVAPLRGFAADLMGDDYERALRPAGAR